MNVARLFDREVALVDRAVARRAEAELLFDCRAREDFGGLAGGLFVEPGIHAVAFEDRKPDLAKRRSKLVDKLPFLAISAPQKLPDVAGPDSERFIERLGIGRFGEAVLLLFLHLVETDEVAVFRVHAGLPRSSHTARIVDCLRAMATGLEGRCRVFGLREGEPLRRAGLAVWRHVGRDRGASAISLAAMDLAPGGKAGWRN